MTLKRTACMGILVAFFATAARGQTPEPPPPGFEGATVVEKPDARVPLDLQFRDEEGRTVRLGDYFQGKQPVLLTMVYLRCPMLCNLTLNGVLKAVQPLSLMPGRDFQFVAVDFDPREGPELAAAKRANYLAALGKPAAAAGWHILTSPRPSAAKALGDAIGFGYKLDPKGEQYLHQAALYVCTPDGRVARILAGVTFDSDVVRDSLIHASAGKIGSGLLGAAVFCGLIHYDPASGKYTWMAVALMRITGILTVLALGTVIGTLIYREKRRGTAAGGGSTAAPRGYPASSGTSDAGQGHEAP